MTTKVNFKINPNTMELDVFIEEDDTSEEFEINFAKRILSLSTQLNFVDLPYSRSIDLGASIIIEKEFYEDYYFDEDSDIEDEMFFNSEELGDFLKNNQDDQVEIEQVENEKEGHNIEDKEQEPSTWENSLNEDECYSIKLDVNEAKKIIGGLTTPSVIASRLVYEMLKRVVKKVEISL